MSPRASTSCVVIAWVDFVLFVACELVGDHHGDAARSNGRVQPRRRGRVTRGHQAEVSIGHLLAHAPVGRALLCVALVGGEVEAGAAAVPAGEGTVDVQHAQPVAGAEASQLSSAAARTVGAVSGGAPKALESQSGVDASW